MTEQKNDYEYPEDLKATYKDLLLDYQEAVLSPDNKPYIDLERQNQKSIPPELFDQNRIPEQYSENIRIPGGGYNFFDFSKPLISKALGQLNITEEINQYLCNCKVKFNGKMAFNPHAGLIDANDLIRQSLYYNACLRYLNEKRFSDFVALERSARSALEFMNWLVGLIIENKKALELEKKTAWEVEKTENHDVRAVMPEGANEIKSKIEKAVGNKHATRKGAAKSLKKNKGFKAQGYGKPLIKAELLEIFPVGVRKLYRFLASEREKENPLIIRIIHGKYCIKNNCITKIKAALGTDTY